MTQEQMDQERALKEQEKVPYKDVVTDKNISIRVFADGTAYAISGFGGRYVRFDANIAIWDYDAPGGILQYSKADEIFNDQNKFLNDVWLGLQSNHNT